MFRRLPVYLLIDTSYSMSGKPIDSVNRGIQTMLSMLRKNAQAMETVFLSLIEFNDKPRQVVPLTDLFTFQAPKLGVNGCTGMGKALSFLAQTIKKEVKHGSKTQKGDWKPVVFLLTDGQSTDDLARGIEEIRALSFGSFVACAAGQDTNVDELKRITDIVVSLDNLDEEGLKKFFAWVTASITVSSQRVGAGKDNHGIADLPTPPPEIKISLTKD